MKLNHCFKLFPVLLALVVTSNETWSFSDEPIHHQLQIELEPSTRFANIKDTIQLNYSSNECDVPAFYLNSALKLDWVPEGWQVQTSSSFLKVEFVKIHSTTCPDSLTLSYSGVLHDPSLDDNNPVESDGLFFSGESYFYPQIEGDFPSVTFEMNVSLPASWHAVSQGKRLGDQLSGTRRVVSWISSFPTEEIYLIGNKYHIYETTHNGLPLYAYLLQEDERLADRYLQTAKSYIDFYSRLIGSYPYEKFALIENSRQTGYGMPSFTFMGSRIIRFPFILHSSYPHEILHNWWGNGVFPDQGHGNWSEGLTAYLADHLLLELKGKGASYRFQEMMKYSNYVNEENDFPLNEFGYRDSMASQAIGYAKLLMVFHMLRKEIDDGNFLNGLKRFYETYKYRYASYDDMRKTFEEVSGRSLKEFFQQWVHRKGAPEIRLKHASYLVSGDRYDLKLTVEQKDPVFKLKTPVAIWTTKSQVAEIHHLELLTDKQDFYFKLPAEPVAIRLDPFNDVFRRLGAKEAPSSLSQTYGAKQITAFLPEEDFYDYQKFATSVAKRIFRNNENDTNPEGSLWIFGKNHPLSKIIKVRLKKVGIEMGEKGVKLRERYYAWKGHSFVFTLTRTDQQQGTMTWVIAGNKESVPGLIRKLPHYGKYGYLVFEGSEPDIRERGIWATNPVGLQKIFREGQPLLLPEQKPLVSFKPFHK